jgi:hypothetical protein
MDLQKYYAPLSPKMYICLLYIRVNLALLYVWKRQTAHQYMEESNDGWNFPTPKPTYLGYTDSKSGGFIFATMKPIPCMVCGSRENDRQLFCRPCWKRAFPSCVKCDGCLEYPRENRCSTCGLIESNLCQLCEGPSERSNGFCDLCADTVRTNCVRCGNIKGKERRHLCQNCPCFV